MKVLRSKVFSWGGETVYNVYNELPKAAKMAPTLIRKYYSSGLAKDFYKLCFALGMNEFWPFPVPAIGIEKTKEGYFSCFADDLDSYDLKSFTIYYDDKGNFYKKSGLFGNSFKQISSAEVVKYLLNSVSESEIGPNDELGNAKPLVELVRKKIKALQ